MINSATRNQSGSGSGRVRAQGCKAPRDDVTGEECGFRAAENWPVTVTNTNLCL